MITLHSKLLSDPSIKWPTWNQQRDPFIGLSKMIQEAWIEPLAVWSPFGSAPRDEWTTDNQSRGRVGTSVRSPRSYPTWLTITPSLPPNELPHATRGRLSVTSKKSQSISSLVGGEGRSHCHGGALRQKPFRRGGRCQSFRGTNWLLPSLPFFCHSTLSSFLLP